MKKKYFTYQKSGVNISAANRFVKHISVVSKNTINKINKLFFNLKNFFLDKNFSNLKSLEKAEILITDNSSIVFEFMLIFKRPIIYIDYKEKIHNINRGKIVVKTIDEEFKVVFGNILNVNNLKSLSSN